MRHWVYRRINWSLCIIVNFITVKSNFRVPCWKKSIYLHLLLRHLPIMSLIVIIGEWLMLLSHTFTNDVWYRNVRRDTLLFISMLYQNISHRNTQSLLDVLIRQSVTIRDFHMTHDTWMIGKVEKSLKASSAYVHLCKLALIRTIISPSRDIFEIELMSKVRRGRTKKKKEKELSAMCNSCKNN